MTMCQLRRQSSSLQTSVLQQMHIYRKESNNCPGVLISHSSEALIGLLININDLLHQVLRRLAFRAHLLPCPLFWNKYFPSAGISTYPQSLPPARTFSRSAVEDSSTSQSSCHSNSTIGADNKSETKVR